MIRLFIENREMELDESVQFAITQQLEDLSNPTTIINSWSKTVSIPFTQSNNDVFGQIYNINRLIVSGSTNVGINFNPYKKMAFRLQWNDSVIMSGYAKMNEIKQHNGKGTYDITLFGELGKIFQELKKITFDKSTDDTTYLIDGSEYVAEIMNKSLVYNSWTSSGQTHETLEKKYIRGIDPHGQIIILPNLAYSVTDIIGFAPNNSFSENFKYDTYQKSYNTSDTFKNELGTGFTADTGVDPETVIPKGYLPREIGEYRSYMQLPYIYWNKLFQLFQAKSEQLTGYKFELDNSWFNSSNPYWYNLVYMLKSFSMSKEGELYNNIYTLGLGQGTDQISSVDWEVGGYQTTSTVWQEERQFNYFFANSGSSTEVINICDFNSPYSIWKLEEGTNTIFSFPLRIYIRDFWQSGDHVHPYLNENNALLITVTMNGSNGASATDKFLVKRSTSTITDADATTIIKDTELKIGLLTDFEPMFICHDGEYGTGVTFDVKMQWKTTSNPSTINDNTVHIYIVLQKGAKQGQTNILKGAFKSGSNFILNDLWNNDYNLFDEVIKYCKMYRISISVDEVNKKIIFQPFNKYFENYSVVDWTDKVDKSKDFNIVPITFDSKYILFNYIDSDTKLGQDYKEKYGVNYGDYRLNTEYNFNSETKNLFDGVKSSMVVTDNILSSKNLNTYHKVVYSFPNEIYVNNKDKEKKQVDLFGAYYFHNGLQLFSTEAALNLVAVKISDDTPFQLANNTYFYNRGSGNRILVYTYPKLDIVNGDNLCVFNTPMENYTYLNNYSGKTSIYQNFWDTYINERYDVQNKKITCYVKIKPLEYIQFKWNKFVKIGNQLCIVNKIYDYDITSNQPTKVDLITIQNPTGYTTNNLTI